MLFRPTHLFPNARLGTMAIVLSCLLTSSVTRAQTVAEMVARGDALDSQQETVKALAIYLEAEKVSPDDPELLIKIATQYGESMVDATNAAAEQAAGENALGYALRALELAPNLSDAHLAVAICYGRLLDFMPAREKVEYSRKIKVHTETAIDLDPDSDYAWHMLGRWHRAVAETNPLLKGVVQIVYGGLPEASLDDSITALGKAAEINPSRVAHHIELGISLAEAGQIDQAKRAIAKGLALPNRERDDSDTKLRGKSVLEQLGE